MRKSLQEIFSARLRKHHARGVRAHENPAPSYLEPDPSGGRLKFGCEEVDGPAGGQASQARANEGYRVVVPLLNGVANHKLKKRRAKIPAHPAEPSHRPNCRPGNIALTSVIGIGTEPPLPRRDLTEQQRASPWHVTGERRAAFTPRQRALTKERTEIIRLANVEATEARAPVFGIMVIVLI